MPQTMHLSAAAGLGAAFSPANKGMTIVKTSKEANNQMRFMGGDPFPRDEGLMKEYNK
jgi:hypothetical protein